MPEGRFQPATELQIQSILANCDGRSSKRSTLALALILSSYFSASAVPQFPDRLKIENDLISASNYCAESWRALRMRVYDCEHFPTILSP